MTIHILIYGWRKECVLLFPNLWTNLRLSLFRFEYTYLILIILNQAFIDRILFICWNLYLHVCRIGYFFALLPDKMYALCTGYIKNFQVYDPHRVGRITVDLQGRVNDCKALTYRQDVKAKEIGEYTERTLPTRQVGFAPVVLSEYATNSSSNLTLFNLLCAVGLCCNDNSWWHFGPWRGY